MTDRSFGPMNDAGFDSMLQSSLSNSLPEDVVKEVTPWRKAMKRIIAGLALQMFSLNFLGLNYLLPFVGLLLTLLGFRALRRENGWLRACFALTLLQCAVTFVNLTVNATIYASAFSSSTGAFALACLSSAALLFTLLCLWRGLLAVHRKAGLPPHAAPAAWLTVWYALVCVLGLLQYSGWLVPLAMIAAYILILRSLWRLSKTLDEAGYAVSPAPVRLPDWAVAAVLAAVLLLGVASGYLFFRQYPMDWSPAETTLSQEAAQVREELLALGFPQEVLDDLAEEDILACAGAEQVISIINDHPFNSGRQVSEYVQDNNGFINWITHTVYDVVEFRFIDVAVRLSGAEDRWRVIHHFQWLENPGYYGTECIQLWPTYKDSSYWSADGPVSGRVLYNDGGQIYTAPYYYLNTATYTYDSLFFGRQTTTDTFAAFSLPADGSRNRGYLAYTAIMQESALLFNSWANYTHQQTWMQYPVRTALDIRQQNSFDSRGAFYTMQDALQFEAEGDKVNQISTPLIDPVSAKTAGR